MATEVKDVIVLLRARRVPGKWSDTVTRDPLLQDAADLLEAAESRATAAEWRVALLEEEAAQRDIEIAFLLGDSAEMAEEAGAVRTEEEAFVWSQIRTNLNARLAASARARLAKGGQ